MKQSTTASGRGRSGKTTAKKTSSQRGRTASPGRSNSRSSAGSPGKSDNRSSDSTRSMGYDGSSGGMRANNPSSTARSQSSRSGSRQMEGSSSHRGRFEGNSPLEKFFLAQLKDIYYAEQKIIQNLPKMQESATTEELQDAFQFHLTQTQRHVKRLEKVFESIGQRAEGKKCEAIEGIAREVEEIIDETEEGTLTRDAALIIAAQKVEHYEIASYGGLVQLAITMELHDAADLLDKTLVEEEDTDARLTEIAENDINLGAEHEEEQEENEGTGETENEENKAD